MASEKSDHTKEFPDLKKNFWAVYGENKSKLKQHTEDNPTKCMVDGGMSLNGLEK